MLYSVAQVGLGITHHTCHLQESPTGEVGGRDPDLPLYPLASSWCPRQVFPDRPLSVKGRTPPPPRLPPPEVAVSLQGLRVGGRDPIRGRTDVISSQSCPCLSRLQRICCSELPALWWGNPLKNTDMKREMQSAPH